MTRFSNSEKTYVKGAGITVAVWVILQSFVFLKFNEMLHTTPHAGPTPVVDRAATSLLFISVGLDVAMVAMVWLFCGQTILSIFHRASQEPFTAPGSKSSPY